MNKKDSLAPVVVFAYNRLVHLEKTIEALGANFLAKESNLIVFSDGPKNKKDLDGVLEVRRFLLKFKNTNTFKNVEIVEATKNKGLAHSIINGVSTIIKKHKKIIVVEDDVLTSRYFLMYMNDALNKFSSYKEIGSIASFVPDIKMPMNYKHSVFVSMRPSSIAWGTWIDRWETTDWDLHNYQREKFNFRIRKKLNSWGNDVAGRLDRYVAGYNNSWAVRFTVSRMKQSQYAVHPYKSVSQHIGFDGSGTNTSKEDFEKFNIRELCDVRINVPDIPPVINESIQREYRKKYKRPYISEIGEYLLVAILGFKKNSFLIQFSKKISGLIKSLNE